MTTPAQPQRGSSVPEPRPRGFTAADREHEKALLAEFVALREAADPRATAVRDELVTMHLPLVYAMARRFRDRGEPMDDLVQVGTIGLIKSVDRFDPGLGYEFSTFATPTIIGEIKRYFRDKSWAVRVPRRLQEMRLRLAGATEELTASQGRSPTVRELAAHLGVSEDDVLEGIESAQAYSTLSLDASSRSDDGPAALVDTLGFDDAALEGVEDMAALRPLIAALPPREQKILWLRFFENKTQSQIASEVGVSQMHVSRLLARSLAQLREGLLVEG